MFGNDSGGNGGRHDHEGFSLGQLLIGLWMWRELESGRLDAGSVFKALFMIAAVLGGGLLLLLAIVGATMPRYDGALEPYAPYTRQTEAPAYVPAWTPRPTWTPDPTATPSPTPVPVHKVGQRVALGDGWTVTVTKVQRWTPSWYRERGWRMVTAYIKVGMPAVENECVWGDMFFLTARSGRTYQGFLDQRLREPQLFDCSDYHRPTAAAGWVTFEVRDADAKGLVLTACPGDLFGCEGSGAVFKLP